MAAVKDNIEQKGISKILQWKADWCLFAREALGVTLDREQEAILSSVQYNARTSVASGTARGKDFVTAVAAMCFMYLTPKWNKKGELISNTKVALTAPTGRQVENIMIPEIARLYNRAKRRGVDLPGRLVSNDIRTESEEWFLTGFKADEHNHEAWSGFHAVNTMFAITEASGIADDTFDAIEGNLQGNSRILLVFNPNKVTGYAARSQKNDRWTKFTLNSLTAPNVLQKRDVIPGQVDYEWVKDKVSSWCMPISQQDVSSEHDDFEFDGKFYRPEDVFRIKVLGKFPKVSDDVLIPAQWIEAAFERYREYQLKTPGYKADPLKLGVDVAGMGRDSSVNCFRYGSLVEKFDKTNSGGKADHMAIAGKVAHLLSSNPEATAQIDTIGEGAGVYSRLVELGYEDRICSAKYSYSATDQDTGEKLKDITGQYTFANMRAYLFWAVRDWLNPRNSQGAMLPPDESLLEEATEIKWKFQSNGSIIIEKKEDIKKRLNRSTDTFDALANTFFPQAIRKAQDLHGYF